MSPIHVDVVHVTTDVIVKQWNEISVRQVENVSTYVNKSHEVDCPCIISFVASTTAHPDPIDILKSCDEIEGSTIFPLPTF